MTHNQGLGQFLEGFSAIEQGIQKIRSNIERIQELQTHILVSTSTQQEDVHRETRESLMTETKNLLFEFKDRVKKIEYENVRLPKNDSSLSLRKQKYEQLREKFTAVLDEYRNVEDTYMKQQKERMARQYRVVNPEANQQEIDDYLGNPSGQPVFQQALTHSGEAKAALAEVQKRHGDIKQIEQTISELATLFREMQLQVEAQDPLLENVEDDVNETLVDMEKAKEELVKANESAKGARKKKWILFGIISFIIFIIVVVIILKVMPANSNSPTTSTTVTSTLTQANPSATLSTRPTRTG